MWVRPGSGMAAAVGKAPVSKALSHHPPIPPRPPQSVLPAAMIATPAMLLRAGTGDGVTVSIMSLLLLHHQLGSQPRPEHPKTKPHSN